MKEKSPQQIREENLRASRGMEEIWRSHTKIKRYSLGHKTLEAYIDKSAEEIMDVLTTDLDRREFFLKLYLGVLHYPLFSLVGSRFIKVKFDPQETWRIFHN